MNTVSENLREARAKQRAALQDEQPPKNASTDSADTDSNPTPATPARETVVRQHRK
jgi:hypothetical protein